MARSAKLLPGMLLSKNNSLVDLTASHRTVCILLHSPIGDDIGAKRLKRMGWHPSTANNLPFVSGNGSWRHEVTSAEATRVHLGAVQDTSSSNFHGLTVQGVRDHGRGTLRQTFSSLKKTCTYSRP